jgi:hypothetical protein
MYGPAPGLVGEDGEEEVVEEYEMEGLPGRRGGGLYPRRGRDREFGIR